MSNTPLTVEDHSRCYRDFLYVYPVISRRSRGLSIGINLNPDKLCNFDCVYCEVDRRTSPRVDQVDLAIIRQELETMVEQVRTGRLPFLPPPASPLAAPLLSSARLSSVIKDFAFSGDGEPTLAPNFAECVQTVADVKRQEGLHETKIVLITNATGLDKAEVQRGLEWLDQNQGEIWAKLDAGESAYYREIDRSSVSFDRILRNLLITAQKRPIVIQTLFLRWQGQMMSPAEFDAYCQRLIELVRQGAQIKEVHAYTIARPTPEPEALALPERELERLAGEIRKKTGLVVQVFP